MNDGKTSSIQICRIQLSVRATISEIISPSNITSGLFAETVGHERELRFDPDYCFSFSHVSAFTHNSHNVRQQTACHPALWFVSQGGKTDTRSCFSSYVPMCYIFLHVCVCAAIIFHVHKSLLSSECVCMRETELQGNKQACVCVPSTREAKFWLHTAWCR